MGDKNPKKQKKQKRAAEKPSVTPLSANQNVERAQNSRPKNQSRGR